MTRNCLTVIRLFSLWHSEKWKENPAKSIIRSLKVCLIVVRAMQIYTLQRCTWRDEAIRRRARREQGKGR